MVLYAKNCFEENPDLNRRTIIVGEVYPAIGYPAKAMVVQRFSKGL
jgi:hypothetical protein